MASLQLALFTVWFCRFLLFLFVFQQQFWANVCIAWVANSTQFKTVGFWRKLPTTTYKKTVQSTLRMRKTEKMIIIRIAATNNEESKWASKRSNKPKPKNITYTRHKIILCIMHSYERRHFIYQPALPLCSAALYAKFTSTVYRTLPGPSFVFFLLSLSILTWFRFLLAHTRTIMIHFYLLSGSRIFLDVSQGVVLPPHTAKSFDTFNQNRK